MSVQTKSDDAQWTIEETDKGISIVRRDGEVMTKTFSPEAAMDFVERRGKLPRRQIKGA